MIVYLPGVFDVVCAGTNDAGKDVQIRKEIVGSHELKGSVIHPVMTIFSMHEELVGERQGRYRKE